MIYKSMYVCVYASLDIFNGFAKIIIAIRQILSLIFGLKTHLMSRNE